MYPQNSFNFLLCVRRRGLKNERDHKKAPVAAYPLRNTRQIVDYSGPNL
jgi:hypothetical protein